jgi:hypothetical protein
MLGAEISADRPMVQRTGLADHAASARSRNCPWNRQKAPAGTRGGRASSGAPPRMAGAGYEPVETNVPGTCAPTAAGIAPVAGARERKSALAAAAGRVGRLTGRAAVTMRDARRCATSAAASPPPDARTLPVRARRATAVAADAARAIELPAQLRRALRAAELVLAYQPQGDPRTGDIRAGRGARAVAPRGPWAAAPGGVHARHRRPPAHAAAHAPRPRTRTRRRPTVARGRTQHSSAREG